MHGLDCCNVKSFWMTDDEKPGNHHTSSGFIYTALNTPPESHVPDRTESQYVITMPLNIIISKPTVYGPICPMCFNIELSLYLLDADYDMVPRPNDISMQLTQLYLYETGGSRMPAIRVLALHYCV
jgi:hypothetical protein